MDFREVPALGIAKLGRTLRSIIFFNQQTAPTPTWTGDYGEAVNRVYSLLHRSYALLLVGGVAAVGVNKAVLVGRGKTSVLRGSPKRLENHKNNGGFSSFTGATLSFQSV